jgi:hypothetical protein
MQGFFLIVAVMGVAIILFSLLDLNDALPIRFWLFSGKSAKVNPPSVFTAEAPWSCP